MKPVYAYRFAGKRFDCGSKLGYLQANVEYALAHPELAGSFKAYLQEAGEGPLSGPAPRSCSQLAQLVGARSTCS